MVTTIQLPISPENPLTAEMVDRDFPLQQPDGMAETIKDRLVQGDQLSAVAIYQNLRAVDHETVELIAEALVVSEGFSLDNLDVLRALRIGIMAGLNHGRTEGTSVVNTILGEGE